MTEASCDRSELEARHGDWSGVASTRRMNYRVDLAALAWESPVAGVRHKLHRVDARVLRLVEYSREMAPHWCQKGHVGHIVEGALEIEFQTGKLRFEGGDAVFIPPGEEHAHRAVVLTAVVTALFVEDAEPLAHESE